jgi:isoquinoline 1-oxidoreductase alpha subunit
MAFLLNINGTNRSVDVDGDTSLPRVPRDVVLGMTGTKCGCGIQDGSSDTIAINKVRSL